MLFPLMIVSSLLEHAEAAQCSPELPGGNSCPSSGFHVFPDPDDCSLFWQCNEGCAEQISCPDGFLFDPVLGWCDEPEIVVCWGSQTTTTKLPCDSLLPGGNSCPSSGFHVYPDPDDCSLFWQCNEGCAEQISCPDGFLFDPVLGWCDEPDVVVCWGATTQPSTTQQPTSAASTSECSSQLPDGESCPSSGFHVFPDHLDCSKFWQCNDGCAEHISCPDGFLFDPVMSWCDEPDNVVCWGSTVTTQSSTETPVCGHGHDLDCESLPAGTYMDQYNCRKYWICGESGKFHRTCEDEFLFDEVNKWCNYPDQVACHNRPICDDCDNNCHTQGSTTTQKTVAISCDKSCRGQTGNFQISCCSEEFCQCYNGMGVLYPCPPGLVFVEQLNACDYPSNVPCCAGQS